MSGAADDLTLRGRVVTPEDVLDDGLVVCRAGLVEWVGDVADAPEGASVPDPTDLTLLPGLVDVHCHGGGGYGFPDADADGLRHAAAHHHLHGTTTLLGSLVSAADDELEHRIPMLASLVEEGLLAGIHLEGPFLSAARCGAQDPAALVPGDPQALARWLQLGRGTVRSMTLAPETENVTELVDQLAAADAVVSIGHTDADAATTTSGIEHALGAGARVSATHLFNGMPQMHHRSPGPVAACLAAAARGDLVAELVGDGVHLDDHTVSAVLDLVGPHQVALVTDAMAAAGMGDGSYRLGRLDVEVSAGVARLAGDEPAEQRSIAGGTALLVDVVRRAAAHHGLHAAVTAASATPAALVGLGDTVGSLRPGLSADVLVTDAELVPVAVLRRGQWVGGQPCP